MKGGLHQIDSQVNNIYLLLSSLHHHVEFFFLPLRVVMMENENSLLLNYKCQLHSKFRIKSKEMLAWILPLEVVDRAQCLKIFTATHKLREIKFSNFT